jgi:transaldolase
MLMVLSCHVLDGQALLHKVIPNTRLTDYMRLSMLSSEQRIDVSPESQLAQLASMTVLSIDSGDLNVIKQYAATGYITDATTNPLFVSQAGLNSGDPIYTDLVDNAVAYALQSKGLSREAMVELSMDRLAVNLGVAIANIVSGYISTEVDPRLSFDAQSSVDRAIRIIAMYEELGVPKKRVLIKLAATWEGIMAAKRLENEYGIQCNLTLVFGITQAAYCAHFGVHLISPFPGRILDWYNTKLGRALNELKDPNNDEGVMACKQMYTHFKQGGHKTICMPASWRPSRGPGNELDEIRALAGTDRMTIPAPLLKMLLECSEPLQRQLDPVSVTSAPSPYNAERMDEEEFRYRMNQDACSNDKLADGIRAFIIETEKLEKVMVSKLYNKL